MVGKDQEPHLVGGPDVQDTFETEGPGSLVDLRGGGKLNLSPCSPTIGIKGYHKLGIGQRVVQQGQIGQGCITTEVGIAALVNGERRQNIGFKIFYKELAFDVGPENAGIG